MNDRLVIRLPQAQLQPSTAVAWARYDSHLQTVDEGSTAINALSAQLAASGVGGDIDIAVVVPAELVLMVQIQIPSKQMRQIKQALPFMVEELIADDIEDVHIAIPQPLDLNQQLVDAAVIRHTLLIDWLDMLLSHDLSPGAIIADSLCLPVDAHGWTVMVDQQRVLIRGDAFAAMAIAAEDFELIIAGLVEQWRAAEGATEGRPSPQFTVISSARQPSDQALAGQFADYLRDHFADYPVKETVYRESPIEMLGATWYNAPGTAINLLQGGYGVVSNDVDSRQRWMLAASIAAVGIVSYLLLTLGSGWYFSSQAQDYQRQSVALYKELYPNERRIVSPRKQMQNHLRLTNTANNAAFLTLLADTAKQLGGAGNEAALTVNQLRFNSERGDLQFEVQGRSLEQLDQFKRLLADSGLQVDINSATEQDNIVMGRIVVRNL